jgi:hypothetical protein
MHLCENGSESVADVALEFRIIANKIGSDISGRILKHQFTEGLPVNIQVSLVGYTAKTNTWGKLVEKARRGKMLRVCGSHWLRRGDLSSN